MEERMSQSCALPDRDRPALLDAPECTRRATGDDGIIAALQDTAATFFTAFFGSKRRNCR